jgi:general stress protein 26
MGTMGEDMTIRFSTFAKSRKVGQIRKNAVVHLVCGASSLRSAKQYVQIEGRAEVTRSKAERHGYWTEELRGYFQGPDDPNYAVVVVRPARIELQGMASPAPEVWTA